MKSSRRVARVRIAAGLAGLAVTLTGCSLTNPPDVLRVSDPGDGRSGQIGGADANSGVRLRNFLVVSNGNGAPGVLVGAISNQTDKAVTVQLAVVEAAQGGQASAIGQTSVTVQPGQFVQYGDPAGTTGGTASPTASVAQPTTSPGPSESIGSGATSSPGDTTSASAPGDIGAEPASGTVRNYRITTVTTPAGSLLQLAARVAEIGGTTIELPVLPPVGEYAYLAPSTSASSSSSSSSSSGSSSGTPSGSLSRSGSTQSADPSGAGTQTTRGPAQPSPSGS